MNNPKKILMLFSALFFWAADAQAVVDFNTVTEDRSITVSGFTDYPPFGYMTYKVVDLHGETHKEVDKRFNIFQELLNDFGRENHMRINYIYPEGAYEDMIRQVRSGDIDMVLGMYHETKLYEGLDYIVPAVISNPITLIMLPSRTGEIKNLEDLKKMKGAMLSFETLSDYVAEQMKQYNVERVEKPYDIFKKLFTGEIDYIFAGYYTGIIEASKLGLRNYITFSKQIIWDIPLFIGVSKTSEDRRFLIGRLGKFCERDDIKEKFNKFLANEIHRYETMNKQIVPPVFIKDKKE